MDKSDGYIDRVKNLPPAPTVATELLDLFKDPDREVDQIVELISLDPSLTAEILKNCNGAYYGADAPVADMFEAVTRMGFGEVYCMVVGLVGASAMSMGNASTDFDTASLWRHCVVTAVAAETIARETDSIPATAFTAGLLHDLGKLVFATVEPAAYPELVRGAAGEGGALVEAEEAVFGVSHAAVGGRLLERWGLPPDVTEAVQFHHTAEIPEGSSQTLAAIIQVANALTRGIETSAGKQASPSPATMTILQLSEDSLPGLIQATEAGLHRVRSLYNMAV